MKRVLRMVIVVVALVIPFSVCYSFADEKPVEGYDVLSFSQVDYDNTIKSAYGMENDDRAIENLCKIFLSVSRASVRNEHYSPLKYMAEDSKSKKTVMYRLSEYEYLRALYNDRGYSISKDSISFGRYECNVNGDTAEASIVEYYMYYINDGFEDENYRIREYYFKLKRDADNWLITDVTTNDDCEQSEGFVYEPIDIRSAIIDEVIDKGDPHDFELSTKGAKSYAPYQWSYDRSVAVSYAAQYYNSVNSFFGSNTYDCQNFASQCVWAGLRGSYSNPTSYVALPAVKKSIVSGYLQSAWYRNVNTGYYSNPYLNWTWDNVGGFAYLIQCSVNYPIGPKGSTTYGAINYVGTADVIAYCTSGTPSATNLTHAMFVTSVTGTYGSRTKDNIKIAAHSSNTNSAYQTLSSYTSYAASKFSRTYISAGYYPSPKS